MNRVQWAAAALATAVTLSVLRVFVAGAYKSLWDLLWYGDWVPGPLGVIGFLAAYYLARPRPLAVAVAMAGYGLLALLVHDITLLHVYAGVALALLTYALSWAARSATAVAAGIAVDTGLRVLAAGAAPVEDPVAAPLLAALAVLGAILYHAEGRTSTPGYGVHLLLSLAVLGLIYPNTLLHMSSIHGYGLAEFTAAATALTLTITASSIVQPARPLRVLQAAAAAALLAENLGQWRLAAFYATAGLAIATSIQRHTSSSRLEYAAAPLLLVATTVAAVGVFAYPYIGTWPLADRLEALMAAASLATIAVARRPQPVSREGSARTLLLAILAPSLAGLAAHTIYMGAAAAAQTGTGQDSTLAVLSYNVHQGYTYNNTLNTILVADYIRTADIACLQEVDAGRPTSAFIDLPLAIKVRTRMNYTYMPAIEGVYGVLVATRHTITSHTGLLLPSTGEQRAALKTTIQTPLGRIVVVNTHLGLDPHERKTQAQHLLSLALSSPTADIICGDLNEEQGAAIQLLQQHYMVPEDKTPTCCLDTRLEERIDYILPHHNTTWKLTDYHVDTGAWYSDHLPVWAHLEPSNQTSQTP